MTKSEIEARPVFVWTPAHIEAHFLVCYVALVVLRLLQLATGLPCPRIREEIAALDYVPLDANWWVGSHSTPSGWRSSSSGTSGRPTCGRSSPRRGDSDYHTLSGRVHTGVAAAQGAGFANFAVKDGIRSQCIHTDESHVCAARMNSNLRSYIMTVVLVHRVDVLIVHLGRLGAAAPMAHHVKVGKCGPRLNLHFSIARYVAGRFEPATRNN